MADKLKKAVFEVYENEKAASPKETVPVLFNPSQYNIDEGASYITYKSRSATENADVAEKKEYAGPRPRTLNLELFFDTGGAKILGADGKTTLREACDVSAVTKKFVAMIQTKGELHEPPVVGFRWGSLHFIGHVESLNTTYTMFTSEGKPVRARMTLRIAGLSPSSEKFKEPFESPDRTKARMVTEDVHVWDIAYAEYGDAGEWKRICRCNDISDPLFIPPGTILKVPALD